MARDRDKRGESEFVGSVGETEEVHAAEWGGETVERFNLRLNKDKYVLVMDSWSQAYQNPDSLSRVKIFGILVPISYRQHGKGSKNWVCTRNRELVVRIRCKVIIIILREDKENFEKHAE